MPIQGARYDKHANVRRLILLRHGQTEWNAADRMQGQIVELSGRAVPDRDAVLGDPVGGAPRLLADARPGSVGVSG